jgi:hypothetical protein
LVHTLVTKDVTSPMYKWPNETHLTKTKGAARTLFPRHGLHPRLQAIKLLASQTYQLKRTKGQPTPHPTTSHDLHLVDIRHSVELSGICGCGWFLKLQHLNLLLKGGDHCCPLLKLEVLRLSTPHGRRLAVDEHSSTRAQPCWGDGMRPSTHGPDPKAEVYYYREEHSHASAARAHVRWWCCTHCMRPSAYAIAWQFWRCYATSWTSIACTWPSQPCRHWSGALEVKHGLKALLPHEIFLIPNREKRNGHHGGSGETTLI